MRKKDQPPEEVDVAVGARVRIRRRTLGLSQTELANSLGVTFQQVQKYERGTNRISASMLVKVAAKLETTVAALVGEDEIAPVDTAIYIQLATPGAPELLAAFAKIKTAEVRNAVIKMVVALGEKPVVKQSPRAALV